MERTENSERTAEPVCKGILCQHGKAQPQAVEEHPCPYQEDINNDPDFRCRCCEACTRECAMEV